MPAISSRARLLGVTLITALVVALMPFASTPAAFAGPIADSDAAYQLCGRTFPDPHAFWAAGAGEDTPHPGKGTSPYAKGNAPCAAKTFIAYEEAVRGLTYLDNRKDTGPFMELIDLSTTQDPRIREVLDEELGDGWSEGLGTTDGKVDPSPLYLVKVTAPEQAVLAEGVTPTPAQDRKHFAWSLSMHGIERAGIEGGLRAIEDMVTWGAHEPNRLLLETYDTPEIETVGGNVARNLTVGEVLMNSVSYFLLPNPDGWRRGDLDRGGASFARFNGNGMDLNRDFPEIGWTDPAFTPWSESESRTYGKVLKNLSDEWTGAIDLHGMVQAKAFSFTLIGASQRAYDKNERTMQFVEQAWDDASTRLSWSANIKTNDEVDQCLPGDGVGPNGEVNPPPCDQRMYGVQYGTIWDTIDYTVTGAVGNWMDSPIGLNADGIDNEMSMSHLGNCGTGNCYLPEFEQLHVDGNKSLIYAMLNFSLQPPPAEFDVDGNVGYFVNPRRLVDPGVEQPQAPEGATAPEDASGTGQHRGVGTTVLHEFTIDNPEPETETETPVQPGRGKDKDKDKGKGKDKDKGKGGGTPPAPPAPSAPYVGGMSAEVRWSNLGGHSAGALNTFRIQYQNPETGEWENRPVYSPGPVYVTAGVRSDWNYPKDGNYRLIATGPAAVGAVWHLNFATVPTWEQPIQKPFDVSNMDFFSELKAHMSDDSTLTAVNVDNVLGGQRDLSDFDTVVISDDAALPGYREEGDATGQGALDLPATSYTAADRDRLAAALNAFVERGGNLVLTDDGLRVLEWMGVVPDGTSRRNTVYAGAVAFTADAKKTNTYDDPLAAGTNQPGSAENTNHRRQVSEPIPVGYSLRNQHPQWNVEDGAFKTAGGRVVGTDGTGNASIDRVTLGEIAKGDGRIRILGSLLPFPTTQNYHPFGMSSYAITDVGYQLTQNLWTWSNPAQNATPNLADDAIPWVQSGVPTRVTLGG